MEYLTADNLAWAITAAFAVSGVAAQIAAWTPNQRDDAIVGGFRKVLRVIAGNYGHSRNFEAVKASEE